MKNYHLTHNDKDWILKKENASRATRVFTNMTKEDAKKELKNIVNNASVKIHYKKGPFQEERTYPRSIDPRRSKG